MSGTLTVKSPIVGYNYNKAGGNAAAFIFDKPGSNWTGIGAHTTGSTIWFGACDGAGNWIDDFKQVWDFNGTIKQQGVAVSLSGHTHDYLPLSGGTISNSIQLNKYLIFQAYPGYGSGTCEMYYDQSDDWLRTNTVGNINLAGYLVLHTGNYTSYCATAGHNHNGTYLSLSGGTLSNSSFGESLTIKRAYTGGDACIKFQVQDTVVGYIGIRSDTTPVFYAGTNTSGSGYLIYHSGNLPAYPTKSSWNYDDVYVKIADIGSQSVNFSTSSGKLKYTSQLTTKETLDSFHEGGYFKVTTWNGNSEETSLGTSWPGASNGIILDGGWTNATYGFQLAIDDDPNYFIALRQKNGNGWQPWKTIPMSDGTNASGTWGISISGNATTASSVAWSNISGKPSTFTPSSHTHPYLPSEWLGTVDCNNISDSRVIAGYDWTNGPSNIAYGSLVNLVYDGSRTGQLLLSTVDNTLYFRTKEHNYDLGYGVWRDWLKIYSTGNFNPSNYSLITHNHSGVYSEVGHTHSYLPLSGGTITGNLRVQGTVFAYRYDTANGHNAPAIVYDKPGGSYTGIGCHGTEDTIWFGAVDGNFDWNDSKKQIWDFNGTIKQQGVALGSRAFDSTSYLPLSGGTLTGNLTATNSYIKAGGNGLQYPIRITRSYNDSVDFLIGSASPEAGSSGALNMRISNNSSGGGGEVYIDLLSGGGGVNIYPSLTVGGYSVITSNNIGSQSVNYASSAGSAGTATISTILLTNNSSQNADDCYTEDPGLRFWRYNGTSSTTGQSGGDGWILSWSWGSGSVGGQIYLDDNPSKIMCIRGRANDANKTFNGWATFLHTDNHTPLANSEIDTIIV